MSKKDNDFCIKFYTVGIAIYSFHLLIYNLGNYFRVKPIYSFFPLTVIPFFIDFFNVFKFFNI